LAANLVVNEEQLARLKEGVAAWNAWRDENPGIQPDLSRADLSWMRLDGANLSRANLREARLDGANLYNANLYEAHLPWADLTGARLDRAHLPGAHLPGANLSKADLSGVHLNWANLRNANLREADLTGARLDGADLPGAILGGANLAGADLTGAVLVKTNLTEADLTGCHVYGIAAWNVKLKGTTQLNLVITPADEPVITVDHLEVAQFIYLLLHNEKIREVINTITSKAVLILGRFTPERKAVLEAIREEIRRQNLLPIMFDFTPSASQTTLETVSTLAHMARFVIADLTDAKSVLQELQAIVPNNPSVPVQPLLLASQEEPGMFDFFRHYPWVLETYTYHSLDDVLASLKQIIARADKARARSDTGRL
jgi:pentapeptide repeat protein